VRHQSYPYELSQSLFHGFCDVAKVVIIQKIILVFGKTFRINNIINPITTSFVSYQTRGWMAMVMGYYFKVEG